ncbi:MAG: bifunctional phosphopantothenoylcysteine decarboxylase/phosphopantothenate--cysteine ligase CoaBC, partial [Psittacicella sp.]
AYKSIVLGRLLKKAGYEIKYVLSPNANNFVTPITLQAISGYDVAQEVFNQDSPKAMEHIDLAKWADLIVIAPISANIISELAIGGASSLIGTIVLASKAKVIFYPSMNQEMYLKQIVKDNLLTLEKYGFIFGGVALGEQACGDVGKGRMKEPEDIFSDIEGYFSSIESLDNSKLDILITLGPTREYLDPVRYITNESSGKMGFSIAKAFLDKGHKVTIVAGPVNIDFDRLLQKGLELYRVISAKDMNLKVLELSSKSNIFVSCAAVADFRPKQYSENKIKKNKRDDINVEFIKNEDILYNVSNLKVNRPFCVGFAAETENIESNAKAKLLRKNADLICLNDVSRKDIGFNSTENELLIFNKMNKLVKIEKASKSKVASLLVSEILKNYLS